MRASMAIAGVVCVAGCNAILGLDAGDPADGLASSSAAGAASASSSATASSSSSGGAASSGGGPSAGGGGASSSGGNGGTSGGGGSSACSNGCGTNETCNELTGICECGTDLADSNGAQACADDGPYRACIDDVNGVRCGCEVGSCTGGFVCDLETRECFCTADQCGDGASCWADDAGRVAGLCHLAEASCSGYGEVVVGGLCTCDNPAASCED